MKQLEPPNLKLLNAYSEQEQFFSSAKIRILIADDHSIIREGLASMLKRAEDIEIVAQAADGEMAVKLADEHGPDVVILDINMPRMNGIDAAKQISQKHPNMIIIGWSMQTAAEIENAMKAAGACVFFRKDCVQEKFVEIIRSLTKA